MITLEEILKSVNSFTDLEYTTPTGTELTTRVNFANQAVREAADSYKFDAFNSEYNTVSTGATVTLPTNFRELNESPKGLMASGDWEEYKVIDPEDKYQYDSDDNYSYVLGNPASGYNLIVNGLSASGASLSIQYQRYPSGFATLADKCEFPDDEYVKQKVISYVLQARRDDRFPFINADANRRLANMIGKEARRPVGDNQTKSVSSYRDFVIGE